MLVCWSVKGGSGTSVVAATVALLAAHTRPSLLVDLAGDLPGVLGATPPPTGPGVAEWLASPTAGAAALGRLTVEVRHDFHLLPAGDLAGARRAEADSARWQLLAEALGSWQAEHGGEVVVDAGTAVPPAGLQAAGTSIVVLRPCYLAITRTTRCGTTPDAAVVIREPGRVLRARDVEDALKVPVLAELEWDPAVARAVDSGLMSSRLPASLTRSLRRAA